MKKEKVLVTGGTGFIGYHILKELINKKFNLYSLSTKKPDKKRRLKNVKYIICDLRNKKNLKKKISLNFKYIINLGGYVDHKNKSKTWNSHYNGCKNLINLFKNKELKNFIQIGSSLEYGNSKTPNKEYYYCRPRGNYGLAKYKASNYVQFVGNKCKIPYTILRLYQIYGPHQTINRLVPITIHSCLKNKSFSCSDGKQYRDFLYVKDFTRLVSLILNKKASNEIYNVGSGKPLRIRNVIEVIRSKIGKGKPEFGKIKMRKDEILKSYPCINKVKKKFKWKPKINFKTGIESTINFYEQNFL